MDGGRGIALDRFTRSLEVDPLARWPLLKNIRRKMALSPHRQGSSMISVLTNQPSSETQTFSNQYRK